MFLPHIFRYLFKAINLINYAVFWLCTFLFTFTVSISFPFRTFQLLTGEADFKLIFMTLLPAIIFFAGAFIFKIFIEEFNDFAEMFYNMTDYRHKELLKSKKDLEREILNTNIDCRSINNRLSKILDKIKTKEKELQALNEKIQSNYEKHENWINIEVPKERARLKAELDAYAIEYAKQKIQEQQDFEIPKSKKNGTFH